MILAAVVAVAVSAPDRRYGESASSESSEILRQDFILEDDGRYSLDVETSNGISVSQQGSPSGPEGAVVKSGSYS